jgi:inorganic pyrophosphatase
LTAFILIADGKPENAFAFSGEAKNKKYATAIVHECHEAWKRLVNGESPAKTPSYDLSMYVFSPRGSFRVYSMRVYMCV